MQEFNSWINEDLIKAYLFFHYYVFSKDSLSDNWLTDNLKKKFNTSINSALDLGCGTGNIAIELAKSGINVLGIDSSNIMIELAKARVDKIKNSLTGNINTIVGNMINPPRGIAEFVFTSSLGHLERREDQVTCLRNVLNNNSSKVFCIFVPELLETKTDESELEGIVQLNSDVIKYKTLSKTDFVNQKQFVHYVFGYKDKEYEIKYFFKYFDDDYIDKLAIDSGWRLKDISVNNNLRFERKKNLLIREKLYELVAE